MIRFACPTCQKALKAAPQKAGMLIDCPRCQKTFQIPDTASTPPGSAPSSEEVPWYKQTADVGPESGREAETPWYQETHVEPPRAASAPVAFPALPSQAPLPPPVPDFTTRTAEPPPLPDVTQGTSEPPPLPISPPSGRPSRGNSHGVTIAISIVLTFLVAGGIAWRLTKTPDTSRSASRKDEQARSSELKPEQVYQRLLKSTVWIITADEGSVAIGSGGLISRSKKLVLTNYHVVGDHERVAVFFPAFNEKNTVITDPAHYVDNAAKLRIMGKVLARDKRRDLALVELVSVPPNSPSLSLIRESATPGQKVHSIGASGVNLNTPGRGNGTLWRYTSGEVRQVYHETLNYGDQIVDAFLLETTAPTNPGDSGGPVINDRGQLIAVVQGGSLKENAVSWNIDIREVRAFLESHSSRIGKNWEDGADVPAESLPGGSSVDVVTLMKELGDSDAQVRAKAANTLGSMGHSAQVAIPALLKTVKDKDENVRRMATNALGKIGPPTKDDLPLLRDALKDENISLRRYAVTALENVERTQLLAFLPTLIQVLKDRDATLAKGAAELLDKIGPPGEFHLPLLKAALKDDQFIVRRYAVWAIGTLPAASAVPSLLEALRDSDEAVRKSAAGSLDKMGTSESTLAVFAAALTDESVQVRRYVISAFGNVPAENAKPHLSALTAALKEPDAETRGLLIRTLAKVGASAKETLLPMFFAGLQDKDMRPHYVYAFKQLVDEKDVPFFLAALKDKGCSDEQRALAAEALGAISQKPEAKKPLQGAVPLLLPLVKDTNEDVRSAAMIALTRIDPDSWGGVPALLEWLRSSNTQSRTTALDILGKLGPEAKPAADTVMALMKDKDVEVRISAISNIGNIEPSGKIIVPKLTEALKDDNPKVRLAACSSLAKYGGKEAALAMPTLDDCLQSKDKDTRLSAMKIMGMLGATAKSAVPKLIKIVSEGDQDSQLKAIETIGMIGPEAKAAVFTLINAFADEKSVNDKGLGKPASEAVVKIGKAAVPDLVDALKHKNPFIRFGACVTLGEIGPAAKEAIGPLSQRYSGDPVPDVRAAASKALRSIQRKN